MFVHHAGHSVKSEAIELVLVHPEAEIRQEEALNFMISVIEESRIPKFVAPPRSLMEVQMVRTIKLVETGRSALDPGYLSHLPIQDIFASMGVDYVQQHSDSHLVSLVDEALQILGRP